MSKNIVERTDGAFVVSMEADSTIDIALGEGVVMSGDYKVTKLGDQNTFIQGIALKAHSSGTKENIPVLLPGPIVNVKAGATLTAGNLVNGDAAVPGEWIVDTSDPAGFVVMGGSDQDQVDICFVGEQA